MPLQAYNADVLQILQKDVLGKDLWGNYFGVELELEIYPRSKFIKNYVEGMDDNHRLYLFKASSHEDKNTPIAHYIGDEIAKIIGDFCIVKRDGSLKNGIEIVSLPMSLDLHHTKWDKFFEEVEKNSYGLKVAQSCGMHVHVSKCNLSPLQIGKILAFIYDKQNLEFIKLISGRTPPSKYASIGKTYKITDINKQNHNKYEALNLTKKHTIEFRIFRSALKRDRFLANIEFCAALLYFASPGSTSIRDNNLSGFISYIKSNKSQYPFLTSFLKDNDFEL